MGKVFNLDCLETKLFQRGFIELDRLHIGQMNPVIDGLVFRGIIGRGRLHRIGKYEIATGLEHARDFFQHAFAVAGMQDGFLAPNHVEAVIGERDVLENTLDNLDLAFEALFRSHPSIARVLFFPKHSDR